MGHNVSDDVAAADSAAETRRTIVGKTYIVEATYAYTAKAGTDAAMAVETATRTYDAVYMSSYTATTDAVLGDRYIAYSYKPIRIVASTIERTR